MELDPINNNIHGLDEEHYFYVLRNFPNQPVNNLTTFMLAKDIIDKARNCNTSLLSYIARLIIRTPDNTTLKKIFKTGVQIVLLFTNDFAINMLTENIRNDEVVNTIMLGVKIIRKCWFQFIPNLIRYWNHNESVIILRLIVEATTVNRQDEMTLAINSLQTNSVVNMDLESIFTSDISNEDRSSSVHIYLQLIGFSFQPDMVHLPMLCYEHQNIHVLGFIIFYSRDYIRLFFESKLHEEFDLQFNESFRTDTDLLKLINSIRYINHLKPFFKDEHLEVLKKIQVCVAVRFFIVSFQTYYRCPYIYEDIDSNLDSPNGIRDSDVDYLSNNFAIKRYRIVLHDFFGSHVNYIQSRIFDNQSELQMFDRNLLDKLPFLKTFLGLGIFEIESLRFYSDNSDIIGALQSLRN